MPASDAMDLLPEGDLADLSTLAIVKQLRSDIESLLSHHLSELRSDLQHHHKQLTSSSESLEGCARQLSALVESGSSALPVGQTSAPNPLKSSSVGQVRDLHFQGSASQSLLHPCEVSHCEHHHQEENMLSPLKLEGSGMEQRVAGNLTHKIEEKSRLVKEKQEKEMNELKKKISKFKNDDKHADDHKVSKFKNDDKHADDYITTHSRKQAEKVESTLERFVTSPYYDGACALVIIMNSVLMVMHTQYMALDMLDGRDTEQTLWFAVNIAFAILFSFDILLRWYVDGFTGFFRTKDCMWNIFDVFIVSCTVGDLVYGAFSEQTASSGISVLRLLRVIRIVRVLRIIRVLRFFKELRLMLYSLLQCLLSMVWAATVFVLIFVIFAVVFTSATVEYCSEGSLWQDAGTEALRDAFGTVDRSMFSLFMSISGGQDWGDYYDALDMLPKINTALYILFIMFFLIAAMNVITGIFVEHAREAAELDRDFLIQNELQEKKEYVQAMRSFFEELDVSGCGGISLAELEAHLDDERAVAYFNALEVDCTEAKSLFTLLDVDRSGHVNFDEFLHGCEKLKGDAKSIDIALLHYEIRWLSRAVLDVHEASQNPLSQGIHSLMCARPGTKSDPTSEISLADTSANQASAKPKTQQYLGQTQAKPTDKLADGCKSTDAATLVSVVPTES